MFYRQADESAPAEVNEAIAWVKKSLSPIKRIREDAKRLKEILKTDPESPVQPPDSFQRLVKPAKPD